MCPRYPITCVAFLTCYCADKFLFLRYYRTPPSYGVELGQSMTVYIPIAVFLHCFFTSFM